jgi:hypothetical protein
VPSLQSDHHESNPQSLAAFYRSLPFPKDGELRWLLNQGIDADAMASPAIRGASVEFDGDTFSFDGSHRVVVFRADDRGEPVDLIAWQPKSGKLATWRGAAFCLGDVDDLFNPAVKFMGGALRIHRTPLEWLCAGRDGIVIAQPKLAYGHFRDGMRIVCTDASHGQQLKKWLRAPTRKVEIFVEGVNAAERSKAA